MVKARTIAVMVGVLADALAPAIAKLKAKKPDGKVEPDVVKAVEEAIRNAGNVTPEMLDAAIAGLGKTARQVGDRRRPSRRGGSGQLRRSPGLAGRVAAFTTATTSRRILSGLWCRSGRHRRALRIARVIRCCGSPPLPCPSLIERRPGGAEADGEGAVAAARPGDDQAACGGGGSAAHDLLHTFRATGITAYLSNGAPLSTRSGSPGTLRRRRPRSTTGRRPHDQRRRDRAHRDLGQREREGDHWDASCP